MSYQGGNGNNFYPYTITTTGTTWVSPNISVGSPLPAMPMQVGSAPPFAEDELGWLRRRVAEITELVAA